MEMFPTEEIIFNCFYNSLLQAIWTICWNQCRPALATRWQHSVLLSPVLLLQAFLLWVSNNSSSFAISYQLITDRVRSMREGYVLTCVCPSTGGYPPWSGWGVPRGKGQQTEYFIRRGRYASCVHAGGLSCFIWIREMKQNSRELQFTMGFKARCFFFGLALLSRVLITCTSQCVSCRSLGSPRNV